MLRVYQATNATDAKNYYTQALAKQDYFVNDQEIAGSWGGEAARRLGIEGPVDGEAFARLCDNLHPVLGEKLTPRTRDDRTVGYDLNFHCPKGISLLHALSGDHRIVEAFREAVAETMAELERNTHTRVRLPGSDGKPRSEDRPTGNLAWAEFVHFTSRPVDGVPDPHLHIHCFVFNATHDPVENRWKAAQFRQVVRDQPYFQAGFHTRLAAKLEALGYPVSRTPEGWDVRGFDRALIEKFSRRTAEIEAEARRLGVTDPTEKSELGARTRAKKVPSLSLPELRQRWHRRLSPEEESRVHRVIQEPERRAGELPERHGNALGVSDAPSVDNFDREVDRRQPVTPDRALDHAIGHVFERNAVESERRLAAEALRHAVGDVQPEEIIAAIRGREGLLSKSEAGERWVTTREILAEETAVLDFAVQGKGTELPLGLGKGGREGRAFEIGSVSARSGITLNDQQQRAVEHLISSRDRVMLLRGGAGTGKTTLLREAAAAIQHGGKRVFACAVTTDASRGVLREAGFKGAQPLETVLTSKKLHERLKNQVIWVDEAGMVGTRTMRRLFELAEKINARVILSGDTKQHAPVERGDGMKLLERQAGIKPAEVTEIIRQSGQYKEAVAAMERDELVSSIKTLDEMGAIKEIRDLDDPTKRHRELADRYIETTSKRRSALVVSPTHAEGREVTKAIRDKLRESGRLKGEDRSFTRLQDLQWTDAEKGDAHRYEPGMVVQFTQHCPGISGKGIAPAAAGTKAKVLAVDADRGLITTEDIAGHRRPLPLSMAARFQVFEERSLNLAVGDTIRITRNANTRDNKHRLNNGTLYPVAGFTEEGHIILGNKGRWQVHKNTGHLTHGYCTTPQAAQGKSVDHCLAAISANSLQASSLEQVYVMLSRGKKSVELLTDKRSAFIDAVAKVTPYRSATELTADTPEPDQKQRLIQHSQEVQRLRMFEENRWRMQRGLETGRQPEAPGRHTPDRQRQQPEAPERQRRQPPVQKRRGREGPGHER